MSKHSGLHTRKLIQIHIGIETYHFNRPQRRVKLSHLTIQYSLRKVKMESRLANVSENSKRSCRFNVKSSPIKSMLRNWSTRLETRSDKPVSRSKMSTKIVAFLKGLLRGRELLPSSIERNLLSPSHKSFLSFCAMRVEILMADTSSRHHLNPQIPRLC